MDRAPALGVLVDGILRCGLAAPGVACQRLRARRDGVFLFALFETEEGHVIYVMSLNRDVFRCWDKMNGELRGRLPASP